MTDVVPIARRIIRRKHIPDLYGLPLPSFDRGVRAGLFPRGFKLGPPPTRAVGWYQDELDAVFARLAASQEG